MISPHMKKRFARANLSNSVLTLPQIPEKCKSCSENVPERLMAAFLKNWLIKTPAEPPGLAPPVIEYHAI